MKDASQNVYLNRKKNEKNYKGHKLQFNNAMN